MTINDALDGPALWDFPTGPARPTGRAVRPGRVVLARQGIFGRQDELHGYELLFRSPATAHLHVDRWSARRPDHPLRRHMLSAAFSGAEIASVAANRRVFVNFTRSFLTADLPAPAHPEQLVIEVVGPVQADDDVIAGLATLRRRGFRIALDDFAGLDSQRRLLDLADYVKIDIHDVTPLGLGLIDLARSRGARLVADHIENYRQLQECRALGFDLFQGNLLDPTTVLDPSAVVPSQRGA